MQRNDNFQIAFACRTNQNNYNDEANLYVCKFDLAILKTIKNSKNSKDNSFFLLVLSFL